jgi:hypothetical protein
MAFLVVGLGWIFAYSYFKTQNKDQLLELSRFFLMTLLAKER